MGPDAEKLGKQKASPRTALKATQAVHSNSLDVTDWR